MDPKALRLFAEALTAAERGEDAYRSEAGEVRIERGDGDGFVRFVGIDPEGRPTGFEAFSVRTGGDRDDGYPSDLPFVPNCTCHVVSTDARTAISWGTSGFALGDLVAGEADWPMIVQAAVDDAVRLGWSVEDDESPRTGALVRRVRLNDRGRRWHLTHSRSMGLETVLLLQSADSLDGITI